MAEPDDPQKHEAEPFNLLNAFADTRQEPAAILKVLRSLPGGFFWGVLQQSELFGPAEAATVIAS